MSCPVTGITPGIGSTGRHLGMHRIIILYLVPCNPSHTIFSGQAMVGGITLTGPGPGLKSVGHTIHDKARVKLADFILFI